MATTKSDIKSGYPLPVYNYRVRIGDAAVAFSEVSGLNVQFEPITYKHGLTWREGEIMMPGMKQPLRISLKRGLTAHGTYLLDWLETVRQNKADRRDLVVDLCDETGTPLVTWQVFRAVPLKLEAPTFNAASNETAIESLEILAADLRTTFH